ncbi:MAG: lipopolysaccharide heptosyltransferase II [Candidatus Omnitrophica bacterium]|nr:lipopolysaccharide heptosyltransferase II [Candidatus Omnitrophota bacterium]
MHEDRAGNNYRCSKKSPVMKEPKRILIVRTDRIGDVVLSTPVIKNLKLNFPNAYLAFMCRPYTKKIVEGNPYLDEVIVYDKYGKDKGIWASIKFAFYLRRQNYDWVIILHPTNRVHLITFLAGIPFRIGWDKKMGFLLSKKIPHKKQEGRKHELEYTLDILRELSIPIVDKTTYFPFKEEAGKKVIKLLSTSGLENGEKFIVIHPSASCPSKRWPSEYFSQVVRLLKEKAGLKIVVVSAAMEREFGEQIIRENEVVDLRGKLNISELGFLFKKAALFVSNDSGPVHIAAAVKTPVISIFGRKNMGLSPLRWRPLGEKSFYFHKDIGCGKCLAHRCRRGFLCLREIKPGEVAEKALLLLQ